MKSRTGNGCSQLTLTLLKLQDGKEHWKQVTTENLSLSWSLVFYHDGGISLSATVIMINNDISGVYGQQNQLHHFHDWRNRLRISSLLSVYKALWVKGKQTVQEWKIDEFNILEQKNLGITRIFLMKDLFKICFEGTTNLCSFLVFIAVSPVQKERVECVVLWKSLFLRQRALNAAACHIPQGTWAVTSEHPGALWNFGAMPLHYLWILLATLKVAVKEIHTDILQCNFPWN